MAEPAEEADVYPGKRNWPGGLVWAHAAPPDMASSNTAVTDGRRNGQKGVLDLVIVGKAGITSRISEALGLGRIDLLFTWFAVGLALVQVFLPFMVLALYDVLEAQEKRLGEAASGLGAGPVITFLRITLPSSLPGLRRG